MPQATSSSTPVCNPGATSSNVDGVKRGPRTAATSSASRADADSVADRASAASRIEAGTEPPPAASTSVIKNAFPEVSR